jgi:transcriptional regulator with XRE-family HTH domain
MGLCTPVVKDTVAESIEDRIIQAAAAVGLSQAELLRQAGQSKNQLANWRQGRAMPVSFVEAVVRVCEDAGLHLDAHWLLTGEGAMRRTPPGEAERVYRLLNALFSPVSPSEREEALRLWEMVQQHPLFGQDDSDSAGQG